MGALDVGEVLKKKRDEELQHRFRGWELDAIECEQEVAHELLEKRTEIFIDAGRNS